MNCIGQDNSKKLSLSLPPPIQTDVECINHIIRIRLKHKPLINQYMACLKELLAAHVDNIPTVMKYTLYNELSQVMPGIFENWTSC